MKIIHLIAPPLTRSRGPPSLDLVSGKQLLSLPPSLLRRSLALRRTYSSTESRPQSRPVLRIPDSGLAIRTPARLVAGVTPYVAAPRSRLRWHSRASIVTKMENVYGKCWRMFMVPWPVT